MKITYSLYRFISTLIGELLIQASRVFSYFTENRKLNFFYIRSGAKIKSTSTTNKKIWMVASSVGEEGVAEILIKNLKKKEIQGRLSFHLSLMTDTSYEIAKKNIFSLSDISFTPIDTVFSVRRAIKRIKPDMICLIETEIWPNLIFEAARENIPVVITNGRLSHSSMEGYKKIQKLLQGIFPKIKKACMISDTDKKRLEDLGFDSEKIIVSGNSKLDFHVDSRDESEIKKRYFKKFNFSKSDQIIVCGSTRRGEEKILVKAHLELKEKLKNIKMILVPRHLDRIKEIENLLIELNADFSKFTDKEKTDKEKKDSSIILVDAMGELKNLYSIADIAFVGGSLIDFGGQNILEPAAHGKPVIFGPYIQDFKEVAEILLKSNGAFQTDAENIGFLFQELLQDKKMIEETGAKAKEAVLKNQGAAEIQTNMILDILTKNQTC